LILFFPVIPSGARNLGRVSLNGEEALDLRCWPLDTTADSFSHRKVRKGRKVLLVFQPGDGAQSYGFGESAELDLGQTGDRGGGSMTVPTRADSHYNTGCQRERWLKKPGGKAKAGR
jgi:hypothetical protein